MTKFTDLDVLKEVPGYKAILKAILKSQIQMLVEQLSEQTDEETVLLTASVSEGSLSHLGSPSGKEFIQTNEELKSQFLGFCLKRKHKIDQQTKLPQDAPHQSFIEDTNQSFDTGYHGYTNQSFDTPAQKQPGLFQTPQSTPANNDIQQSYNLQRATYLESVKGNSTGKKRRISSSPLPDGGQIKKLSTPTATARYEADKHPSTTVTFDPKLGTFVDNSLNASGSTTDVKDSPTEADVNIKTEAADEKEITDIPLGIKAEGVQMSMDENQGGSNEDGLVYSSSAMSRESGQGMEMQSRNDATDDYTASMDYTPMTTTSEANSSSSYHDDTLQSTSELDESVDMPNAAEILKFEMTKCLDPKYADTCNITTAGYGQESNPGAGPIRVFPCTFCEKIFRGRSQLNSHLLSHTGSRPHACQFCNRTFGHRHNLTRHVRTLGEPGSFTCSFCQEEFMTKCMLVSHEKNVHLQQ